MAGWDTFTVAEIVEEISDQAFVLPVVQRRLVWEGEKMELLYDTLLKGDAFGGIMVIEESKGEKPLFESRPFTLHGDDQASTPPEEKLLRKTSFVIDGQQRLQSFYIGLRGRLDQEELYFDLFSDHRTFFEFKFSSDIHNDHKKQKRNNELQDRPVPVRKWHRVSSLFEAIKGLGENADSLVDDLLNDEEKADTVKVSTLRANVAAFQKNIFDRKRLGVDSVSLDRTQPQVKNRQRIVELFRRLNDGGTALSSYDLFASMLKGFNWRMEAFLDDLLAAHRGIGLNQDNLIKLVFLLQGDPRKDMDSIAPEDANFAVENQQRIASALKQTHAFLEAAKLKDYFASGNRSFIPIYFIAYHLFYQNAGDGHFENFDTSHSDFKLMRDWVYHSLLNCVFRSRGMGWDANRTGVARILEVMEANQALPFPLTALLDHYRNHLHVFSIEYRADDLDRLERDFLFYLIYDFNLPTRDVDHIHPKSRLAELNVPSEKINCIANYQLLDVSTNRGTKNAAFFHDWLNGSTAQGANVVDIPGFLERHLIPTAPATHQIAGFDAMLTARAKLIAEKLKERFQS
jgi:hypothetical protein